MSESNAGIDAYVPRIASEWDLKAPDSLWQSVDGTLVFVDISGFTNLSERLARRGRIGAEELTGVLNRVFGSMLQIVFRRGGSLLKFGGDALLLLFDTADHVMQATAATVEMRAALRDASKEKTSVGRINLKMSSGIHTGQVDFFLVGNSHRELIVTGPTASKTTDMEGTADASEIVVSGEVKDALPSDFIGDAKGDGWLLKKRVIHCEACGPVIRADDHEPDLASFVPLQLREHLSLGLTESEHRIATIGFLKFKGVDSMLAADGPDAVGKALDDLVTTVQNAADEEGVTFLASDIDADGGKIILSAGVPTSQHDDEGRMLRTARQILDTHLELGVRIGVNRGHVFSGDVGTEFRRTFTVMGDTVNLAARLMASADSGQLYASPPVLNLSSTLFKTQPLEAFYVKGKEQPVQAFAVHEETGVRPPETTAELPFHGREAELEMLVGIVNTCSRVGRGGIMTISGDTGVGKSRLIAEVLDRCSGMDIMAIQAEPSGVDNPYWAFRDPLRRFLGIKRDSQRVMSRKLSEAIGSRSPDLSWALPLVGDVMHIDIEDNERTAEIDPRFRPERTADALIDLLSAGRTRPVAVVAEDGQWLDDASTSLLARIGAAAVERPWTVLVTARKAGADFEAMGDEIALWPLDDDAIREIAIEVTQATPLRPHELEVVVTKADGNPLFLGEILRVVLETGSAEQLPDSLDAVIFREIDTLPALPRQVLRYSSVLGRRFRRPVLDEFLAPEQVEFDQATVRELSRFIEDEGDDRLAFRHNVVHEIAYGSLPYAKRRELHARAGDVIERQAGNDPNSVAEYLSTHYSQSGEYEKAWKYSRVAADRAKRAYANTEAVAHYRRALEAGRRLTDTADKGLAPLWFELAGVQELAGEIDGARDSLSMAMQATDDPVQQSKILERRAGLWMVTGNLGQAKRAITLARKPVELDGSVAHMRQRARLEAFDSSVHGASGQLDAARQLAERAAELAEASGEDEALARAYGVLEHFAQDESYGKKAIDIYQRLGFLERSAAVINNLGGYAYWRGDWDSAIEWYEKAVETANRAGNVVDAAVAQANKAEVLIGQRKCEEAKELLDEAERVIKAAGADQWMPLLDLLGSRARIGLDDLNGSVSQLEDLFERQLSGSRSPWAIEIGLALAEALVNAGSSSEALSVLERMEDSGLQTGPAGQRIRAMAIGATDAPTTEELLRSAVEQARESDDVIEEHLAIELLIASVRRTGRTPDPADAQRLTELTAKLGIAA